MIFLSTHKIAGCPFVCDVAGRIFVRTGELLYFRFSFYTVICHSVKNLIAVVVWCVFFRSFTFVIIFNVMCFKFNSRVMKVGKSCSFFFSKKKKIPLFFSASYNGCCKIRFCCWLVEIGGGGSLAFGFQTKIGFFFFKSFKAFLQVGVLVKYFQILL